MEKTGLTPEWTRRDDLVLPGGSSPGGGSAVDQASPAWGTPMLCPDLEDGSGSSQTGEACRLLWLLPG
jgi:hypothetical protein